MKKYFLGSLFLAGAAGLCYWAISNQPGVQKQQLSVVKEELLPPQEEKEEETDGPSQLLHREYLMTLDPATGEVPTERIAVAERAMQEMAMSGRVQASNIVWQERGPNNIGGRTRAVLIDKADATGNTVWAGGVGGGLWKTTNFKNASPTWTQVAGISANLAITCIAQHPGNNQVIYVGTGEGFGNIDAIRGLGVYTTTNGGTSWTLLPSTTTGGANQNDFNYVQKLLVYTNGDVYAACRSIFCNAGGLMKSTTNGSTWTRVIGTATGSCATSLNMRAYDIEQSASGDLYASTIDRSAGSVGRVWKSPAGGTVGNAGTWVNVTPAGTFQRIELACSPANNLKIYATTQGAASSTGGTRVSIDGASSWSTIDVGNWCDQGSTNADFTRNQAWYDLILGVKPTDDATVYVGGIDIFKTTNSGTGWSQLTQWASGCATLPYVHADIHAFEFFPGSPDEFIVGCDGGLFYTTNGGTSFTNKNLGYNVTQYYGLAIHPTSGSNYLLAGAQDNGSHRFTAAGINSVTTVTGGDGAFCHIDTDNPNFQFTSFTGCTFNRSTNGGTSFSLVINLAADRFINPSDYDSDNDIMYCGAAVRNFRRILTITGTPSSSSITNVASSTNHAVSAIKKDPNGDRVWVAFSTADNAAALVAPELYIIDNASTTATSTPVTLPAGIATSGNYISSLDIENGDANHVVLTLSNYGVTSVWETANAGATWTAIEGNLPDMPVRWCKFMPAGLSPNTRVNAVGGILLATELGVWSTNLSNGASTVWVANNTGMGNVRTDMIRIRTSDNKIAVATHGRGLFTGTHTSLLPVTLTEFKGAQQGKAVLLQWATASELNSKHFELQKSYNGTDYRTIATISAAGNSNSRLDYSYLDNEPLTEANHYRLRSVDLDGNNKLSNVVLIRIAGLQQDILVLNNPFRDYITIRLVKAPQTKTDIRLFDMSGRLVSSQQSGPGVQQILLNTGSAKASRAVYQLVAVVDGKQYSQQVIAQ
jgi:hypothetical protein